MAAACLALSLPPAVFAQESAFTVVEENFRRDPNGELLGRLEPGAPLTVLGRQGDWLNVEVGGWIWERSLQQTDRDELDLVVSEAEGENLRAAPSGDIIGRMDSGTVLASRDRQPGWIRVVRAGWIWGPSVQVEEQAADASQPSVPPVASSSREPSAEGPVAGRPTGFVAAGSGGAAILTSPDGDTLALTPPGAEVEVVARDGNWARVRIEGWAWMPVNASPTDEDAGDAEALTLAEVENEPAAHRGRVVSWTLQFISLERAEAVRTDFFEGEPFLLTRYGGPDGAFVYVALPPASVELGESLLPLERIAVTGRIRSGSSAFMGRPIVDLLSLERIRGGR